MVQVAFLRFQIVKPPFARDLLNYPSVAFDVCPFPLCCGTSDR
jgi:hypothetical protein